MRKFLKNIILKLIKFIEIYEFKNMSLDENDINKKIISTINLEEFETLTDTGWHPITHLHTTQPYTHHQLNTESGKNLICADNHIVFDENLNEVFVKNLKAGDFIQTKDGLEKIESLEKENHRTSMFDVTVNSQDHRYYTNDILSHNTITSGIFLAWYLCFHFDRNILVVANKQATAGEIVSKIKEIIKHLPFFLKPGVVSGGALGLSFDNGCRLFSQATTKTAAIGFTIHLLYADEFAHIQRNFVVPFYRSIYPTLSSSKISKIIISSTPNGENLFKQIYTGAVNNTNTYTPIRVDWWEVPGRDEKWKEQEIQNLGSPELFEQEYGNKFIASSTMLLSAKIIELTNRISREYEWKLIEETELLEDDYIDLKWHPDFDPNLVWEEDDKFVISVDLADGVGRDYTVLNIFKLEAMSPAQIRKTKSFNEEHDFFRLRQIGKFHSNIRSIEEVTRVLELIAYNIFDPEIITIILEINFKGNYLHEKMTKNPEFVEEMFLYSKHSVKASGESLGVKLNRDNKQTYCRELKREMGNKRIVVTDEDTIEELSSFGLNDRGLYEGQGSHDDLAMSCVNLLPYFESEDFYEHVEDIIDLIDENSRNAMFKKMEEYDGGDDYMDTIKVLGSM